MESDRRLRSEFAVTIGSRRKKSASSHPKPADSGARIWRSPGRILVSIRRLHIDDDRPSSVMSRKSGTWRRTLESTVSPQQNAPATATRSPGRNLSSGLGGVTEPDAGSDTTSIRTTAERVGDGYIVRGQKWKQGTTTRPAQCTSGPAERMSWRPRNSHVFPDYEPRLQHRRDRIIHRRDVSYAAAILPARAGRQITHVQPTDRRRSRAAPR